MDPYLVVPLAEGPFPYQEVPCLAAGPFQVVVPSPSFLVVVPLVDLGHQLSLPEAWSLVDPLEAAIHPAAFQLRAFLLVALHQGACHSEAFLLEACHLEAFRLEASHPEAFRRGAFLAA